MMILLALIAAHYIADFALQNDFVANVKGKIGIDPHAPHALIAHCVHHGALAAAAMLITAVPVELAVGMAIFSAFLHGLTDYLKAGRNLFGIHVDQGIHLATAALIAWIVTQ